MARGCTLLQTLTTLITLTLTGNFVRYIKTISATCSPSSKDRCPWLVQQWFYCRWYVLKHNMSGVYCAPIEAVRKYCNISPSFHALIQTTACKKLHTSSYLLNAASSALLCFLFGFRIKHTLNCSIITARITRNIFIVSCRNIAFADRRGYLIMSLSRITTWWSLQLSEINNITYAVKTLYCAKWVT